MESAKENKVSNMLTEFVVDLSSERCSQYIQQVLTGAKGVKSVLVNQEKQTVLVDSDLPVVELKQMIEKACTPAILTGFGRTVNANNECASAVAIMQGGKDKPCGVIRLAQTSFDTCVVDGALDGLTANGTHKLGIHESGDLSNGCNSCGEVLDFLEVAFGQSKYGDLGMIRSDSMGRSTFRIENKWVQVWNVIGRSIVVQSKPKDTAVWQRVACGVIARSAGVLSNEKRVCACDGTTIWDGNNSSARDMNGIDKTTSNL